MPIRDDTPNILLPNGVEVKFYPENDTLEEMMMLAKTRDFMNETETMRKVGCYPPFNLLVYDNFLALGLYGNDVSVGVRDYRDSTLIDWVDMALSLRKHPIRVVEKTSKKGLMFERLKPRTDLDWIEYDSATQVIREIKDVLCPAQKYLDSMSVAKDLYSLVEYDGRVEVVHMHIEENLQGLGRNKRLIQGIMCKGSAKQFLEPPIENVERELKEMHPEALVIREPLIYCSHGCSSKPWGCLPHIFEKVYAKKIGFEWDGAMDGKIQFNNPSSN